MPSSRVGRPSVTPVTRCTWRSTPRAARSVALDPQHRSAVVADLAPSPCDRSGVRRVSTCRHAKSRNGKATCMARRVPAHRDLAAVATGQHRSAGPRRARRRCRSPSARRRRRAPARRAAGWAGGTRSSAAGGSTGRGRSRSRARAAHARRCPSRRRRCDRRSRPRSVVTTKPSPSRAAAEPLHPHAEPDRQPEVGGIRLEVGRDVVLAGERPRVAGERHPGQPVVPRRGVEPQRVVLLAPAVPDGLVALEHDALVPAVDELARRGEAGLARRR